MCVYICQFKIYLQSTDLLHKPWIKRGKPTKNYLLVHVHVVPDKLIIYILKLQWKRLRAHLQKTLVWHGSTATKYHQSSGKISRNSLIDIVLKFGRGVVQNVQPKRTSLRFIKNIQFSLCLSYELLRMFHSRFLWPFNQHPPTFMFSCQIKHTSTTTSTALVEYLFSSFGRVLIPVLPLALR